jgi:hypothetical protein
MSEKKNINKSVKEVKRYRSMILRDPKQNKNKKSRSNNKEKKNTAEIQLRYVVLACSR